ncbi:MAG: UDP-N-acetylglucosamine 1-carboxyvinyltransferase [Bacillati bacterium ANGP1]|uniref:UDP-N-acetylglucosamine 1-carboxyvinyltransferase n=1 Tax=Candidatus Segetimicrobium genomatis TaxID=2569760 RepID=A0A537J612_9BACT|nr:MAG: UDP-N-acetylglucosamine 1-carboxyvinyltransferase [Terrabacteria group bacterium ANGP1]
MATNRGTDKLLISGGARLQGRLRVAGAKNSSLAVIAAAALAPDRSVLENVPLCRDVLTMLEILRALGVQAEFTAPGRLELDARQLTDHVAPYELCRQMRASIYVAGMLLARVGRAQVPLPGGCVIGSRPVDFHIRGFETLGAQVVTQHGFLKAYGPRLTAASYYVPRSSVGTTINLMLAASRTPGATVLQNAAREPEIVDTAVFLSLMGARVRGAGTSTITVEGTPSLRGATYSIIPDRIEAGTYLIAAAATHGDVLIEDLISEHVTALLAKLTEAGVAVASEPTGVRVRADADLRPVDVDTAPYPGFATDLHPQFAAMLAVAAGRSSVRETIFESRFGYVDELRRMGADIRVEGDRVIIAGVPHLSGAPVEAMDLRAGAALVVAGLEARGETQITRLESIDRGYEGLDQKLRALGARIERRPA